MRSAILVVFVLGACGDNIHPAIDARQIDSALIDVPAGPCGAQRQVTGELVELDSTPAAFVGINNATLTQRGGVATDETPPNGRFDMCVASTTSYVFDINAPATHVDAIAYFEVEALQARMISFRLWTPARAATFYTSLGLTYDPAKAHVLVFLAGDRSNLTLSGGSHDTPQAGNDDASPGTYTWAAGASGRYVLFPNVNPAASQVMVIGDLSGAHTVPVESGKITLVAASWVFL